MCILYFMLLNGNFIVSFLYCSDYNNVKWLNIVQQDFVVYWSAVFNPGNLMTVHVMAVVSWINCFLFDKIDKI